MENFQNTAMERFKISQIYVFCQVCMEIRTAEVTKAVRGIRNKSKYNSFRPPFQGLWSDLGEHFIGSG